MEREGRSPFATRLRALRKGCGMTQEDIAAALNMHRTTYTKYETDKANPDRACLACLAELFGVSVDFLIGNDAFATQDMKDALHEVALNRQERRMLSAFRDLTDEQRRAILQSVEQAAGNNK